MRRCYKFVLVFLGSMFMFPTLSSAQCSYERQAELSRIANNVQFSYNYLATSDQIQFLVNITNLTNDVYLKASNGTVISGLGERQLNYFGGSTIRYDIYSKDSNCPNVLLSTKYITLPVYNGFADYDECQKYPNFKYCQRWINTSSHDEDYFDKELKKYIESLRDDQPTVEKKQMLDIIKQKIKNFGNVYFIGTIIGIMILTVLMIVLKRVRK